jgi:hypothetical protein
VCSSLTAAGELISRVVLANTGEEAGTQFQKETEVAAKEIFGPFFKKKEKPIETTTNSINIKFSNQTKRAIYNDWEVNAFLLEEPKDHAYLIFIKKTDGKKAPVPKGTVVVPLTELRII